MAVLQFDPKEFAVIVSGFIISGFSDDDFIEVERDEDMWTKKVGVDGEVTRAKSNNKSGHVVLRIMQSASSNDDLTTLALADEATNGGSGTIICKDGSGRTAFFSDSCWVKKFPKTAFKKGVIHHEWTIDCGVLDVYIGGNDTATPYSA